MKNLFKLSFNIIVAFLIATIIAPVVGVEAAGYTFIVINAIGFLPFKSVPIGALGAPVVQTELFTGELITKFRFVGKWLGMIPSQNQYVNNNVIHLNDVGADPNVLINNNTYPIATASRSDSDIALSLKKFDTENTKVSDDELYALTYDKISSVVDQHKAVLEEVTAQYGLYSLTPTATSSETPIVVTTGADNGAGRKRMIPADIATAKIRLDNLKVPLEGRVLVLCNDHINDLLTLDQSFRDRFYNTQTGQAIDFMGFKIFQDVYNPIFDASGAKRAWGATAAPSTDRNASVFFFAPRAFQAVGDVKMYYTPSHLDAKARESVLGFRLYHIVLPKKNVGFGAIVSAIV